MHHYVIRFKDMKIAHQTKNVHYLILGIIFVMTPRHNNGFDEPIVKNNHEVLTPSVFNAFTTFL